jgi:hypothetical protein
VRKAGPVADWGGCGGGVADPRLFRDGVFTLGPRVVGAMSRGSLGPGSGVGGSVVSVRRKASKAASPPLMVRICVGPCEKGANCTLHLVSRGRRSESLGLPLVTVAACIGGVGTPASRLVIEAMPHYYLWCFLGGGCVHSRGSAVAWPYLVSGVTGCLRWYFRPCLRYAALLVRWGGPRVGRS